VIYRVHRAHVQIFAKPVHLLTLSAFEGVENIGALVLFVPRLGALGATLADGVVSLAQLTISSVVLRRTMRIIYDVRAVLLGTLGSVAAGLVVWFTAPFWRTDVWMVLPILLIAALVYGLSLTRQLREPDAELFMSTMPQRLRQTRVGTALASGIKGLWVKAAKA
jgi:hypothetical protein